MARYTGPNCRVCKAAETRLFLKGRRCMSDKCLIKKQEQATAGMGGARKRRRKDSDYAIQLRAKQKVRNLYGVLERQFRNLFDKADREVGKTGEKLLVYLERRLDNVVYRMGFFSSRKEARQFVRHGHIRVDGRRVNIPSYMTKEGQEISITSGSGDNKRILDSIDFSSSREIPKWLEVNHDKKTGKIILLPSRQDIDADIDEQMIVEFYSR